MKIEHSNPYLAPAYTTVKVREGERVTVIARLHGITIADAAPPVDLVPTAGVVVHHLRRPWPLPW